jgi:hypothetical protein
VKVAKLGITPGTNGPVKAPGIDEKVGIIGVTSGKGLGLVRMLGISKEGYVPGVGAKWRVPVELLMPGIEPKRRVPVELLMPGIEPKRRLPVELLMPGIEPKRRFPVELLMPGIGRGVTVKLAVKRFLKTCKILVSLTPPPPRRAIVAGLCCSIRNGTR